MMGNSGRGVYDDDVENKQLIVSAINGGCPAISVRKVLSRPVTNSKSGRKPNYVHSCAVGARK